MPEAAFHHRNCKVRTPPVTATCFRNLGIPSVRPIHPATARLKEYRSGCQESLASTSYTASRAINGCAKLGAALLINPNKKPSLLLFYPMLAYW